MRSAKRKIKKGGKKRQMGHLWAYDMVDHKLDHLQVFENNKPEGIAFNRHKNELLLTFDHGKKRPSKIVTLRGF